MAESIGDQKILENSRGLWLRLSRVANQSPYTISSKIAEQARDSGSPYMAGAEQERTRIHWAATALRTGPVRKSFTFENCLARAVPEV